MLPITQKELSEYVALKREINAQKLRADALERQISRGYENSWWNRRRRSDLPTDRLVELKIGLEVSIIKDLEILEAQALRIETAIQAIDEPILRELMRLRYLEGLEWDKLGREVGYVPRQCLRLHKVALNRINHTQRADLSESVK